LVHDRGGGGIFRDALVPQQARDQQEGEWLIDTQRLCAGRELPQVDARSREQSRLFRLHQPFGDEELPVFIILEEHCRRPLEGEPVKTRHDHRQ
jgi:hypothetical protein